MPSDWQDVQRRFYDATADEYDENFEWANRSAMVDRRVIVDHGCRISAPAFLSPGVVFCRGGVPVKTGRFLGAGVTVLPNLTVVKGAEVGAGAVVLSGVRTGEEATGVSACPRGDPS